MGENTTGEDETRVVSRKQDNPSGLEDATVVVSRSEPEQDYATVVTPRKSVQQDDSTVVVSRKTHEDETVVVKRSDKKTDENTVFVPRQQDADKTKFVKRGRGKRSVKDDVTQVINRALVDATVEVSRGIVSSGADDEEQQVKSNKRVSIARRKRPEPETLPNNYLRTGPDGFMVFERVQEPTDVLDKSRKTRGMILGCQLAFIVVGVILVGFTLSQLL